MIQFEGKYTLVIVNSRLFIYKPIALTDVSDDGVSDVLILKGNRLQSLRNLYYTADAMIVDAVETIQTVETIMSEYIRIDAIVCQCAILYQILVNKFPNKIVVFSV